MKILIPGSFDPPTNGHIDVITRCLKVFDEVLVGVIVNPSKESLFSTETRTEMLNEVFNENKNVYVSYGEYIMLFELNKSNEINHSLGGLFKTS